MAAAATAAPNPLQLAAQSAQAQPIEARFYPYDYNGGCVGGGSSANAHPIPAPAPDALLSSAFARSTVLAVAGKDFAIVAGDTRMSTGFNIKSRNVSKIFTMCAALLSRPALIPRARA